MEALIPFLVVWVVCAVACYYIAHARGADGIFWAMMGLLFGPFAIPFAARS